MSLDGIIIIDKPKDITSFRVVSVVRKSLGVKKVGHMGTLDPMATGVLPIMLGKATKTLDLIENHKKKYIASVKFGIETDTQDITGKITRRYDKKIKYGELQQVLIKFIGEIFQTPPMYSAIKKNGVRLYELARKGECIEREKRKIHIGNIDIKDFDEEKQEAKILVDCSRGTYIRSLCSDIGKALSCGATMTDLRRLESNGFSIDKSLTIEEFLECAQEKKIENMIIPIESLFESLEEIHITPGQAVRFKNGAGLLLSRIRGNLKWRDKDKYRIFDGDKFLGLGIVNSNKNELSVFKILN